MQKRGVTSLMFAEELQAGASWIPLDSDAASFVAASWRREMRWMNIHGGEAATSRS